MSPNGDCVRRWNKQLCSKSIVEGEKGSDKRKMPFVLGRGWKRAFNFVGAFNRALSYCWSRS